MNRSLFFIIIGMSATFAMAAVDPDRECPTRGPWFSVECRPHPGECYNSCADHRFCALVDDENCPREGALRFQVHCFCKVGTNGG